MPPSTRRSVPLLLIAVCGLISVSYVAGSSKRDECFMTCVRRFTAGVQRRISSSDFELERLNWDDLVNLRTKSNLETETNALKHICQEFVLLKSCVFDYCPGEIPIRLLNETWSTVDFVCTKHYDAFQKQLPCLHTAEQSINQKCRAQYNETVSCLKHALTNVTNREELSNALRKLCTKTQEAAQCIIPATIDFCGSQAGALIADVLSLNFQSIRHVFQRLGTTEPILPDECRDLTAFTVPANEAQTPDFIITSSPQNLPSKGQDQSKLTSACARTPVIVATPALLYIICKMYSVTLYNTAYL